MTKTQLMGILNITPDSFFDKGQWNNHEKAVQRGLEIARQGADWIDIGGESTRPNATPVSEEEELKRVIPIIKALTKETPIPLSIDTMKAKVAEAAIEAGAQLINDVRGFRDSEMRKVAADTQKLICVMHMPGTPQTMQQFCEYENGVIPFLLDWFKERIDLLLASGVAEKNIILDPGIGFGKSVNDNLAIIQNIYQIKQLGFPVLIGLSRKSFMSKILHKDSSELLTATLVVNLLAIQREVDFIRVHDIVEHRDMIELMNYIKDKK